MHDDGETLTVTIQGPFSEVERVTLVRQSDGLYHEIDEAPRAFANATTTAAQQTWAPRPAAPKQPARDASDALTVTLEGAFGEEHRVRLVRRANGEYEEVLEPCDAGCL